jgi:CheY-like chemotaxis protein
MATGITDTPADRPSLFVLVVDDDEINRRVVQGLLGRLGHRVVAVGNGEAAIAAAKAAVFDAVLMDLRMPGMDGMDAARRIRAQSATVRIVAMTADFSDETWRRCAAQGMDAGLAKPVRLDDLRRALAAPVQAPIQAQTQAPLDRDFLADQLDILGPRELTRLARLFQRVSRQILWTMDAAIAADDRAGIKALAHRLRSAAGPLGLSGLIAAAAAVEADTAPVMPDTLAQAVAGLRRVRLESLHALRTGARALPRRSQPGSTLRPSR